MPVAQGAQGSASSAPVKKPAAPQQPKKEEAKKPETQAVKDMQKISTYNGDSTEKYDWSQTIQEVTVQIPVPEGTTSKMMDIKIEPKKLFVKIKG